MTPTLLGRIQTRWVMVWTVGVLWLLIIGPFLPMASAATVVYSNGLAALLLTAVVGTLWEFAYHAIQQLRWDKDWPTLLGLLVGLSEGFVVYRLLAMGIPWAVPGLSVAPFVWQFGTIWVAIWLVVNGPLRIFFPRWRFAGGRFR